MIPRIGTIPLLAEKGYIASQGAQPSFWHRGPRKVRSSFLTEARSRFAKAAHTLLPDSAPLQTPQARSPWGTR